MLQHMSAIASVLTVGINFLLILFFLWKCRRVILESCREIPRGFYVGLACLIAVLVVLYVFFIPPAHSTYTDEFLYQQAARSVLTQGHFGTLLKSRGWAFMISLVYFFCGANTYASIYLSEVLGVAAVVCFFFLAAWAGADKSGAFFATLIFAFLPARVSWAATGESHTACLFFIVSAMAFSFLFYRTPGRSLFWLVLLMWSYAVQIRGENIFLLGLFFLGIRQFLSGDARRNIPCLSGALVCGCLIWPQVLSGMVHVNEYSRQLQSMQHQGIGLSNFIHNVLNYGPEFLWGKAHPFLLSFLALTGFVVLVLRNRRLAIFLSLWCLLMAAVYFSMWLDVYGNSPDFWPKTRLFLFFYPPLLLFVSFSAALQPRSLISKGILGAAVCIVIFLLWDTPCYSQRVRPSNRNLAQMKTIDYVERLVPEEDVVVTCHPEVLAGTTSLCVVSARDFLENETLRRHVFIRAEAQGGEVLFVETKGIVVSDCRDIWPVIRDRGRAHPVKTFSCGRERFSVDKLTAF